MTALPSGYSDQTLFSTFSTDNAGSYRTRNEAFVLSLLAQFLILFFIACATRYVIVHPVRLGTLPTAADLPLVFSGHNGGGGGNFDLLPASHGNIPKASLEDQIVAPTVKLPTEMPKMPVEETVMVAPDIKLPQGGQIGDPTSQFLAASNGPGGPGGIGPGCCNGIGPSAGPSIGAGPPGIVPAGKNGVTVPEVIFNPEPSFSDEARKAKVQGIVVLLLVVGRDGRPSNVRVGQSLGMGLDEKAIEAVGRWRFRPATLNGQPVATQIAVEVNFHLY
jgi:TonB family protein